MLSQHYGVIPDKGGEENPKEGRENDEEHEKNSNDKELLTNVKMRERKLNINMSKIMLLLELRQKRREKRSTELLHKDEEDRFCCPGQIQHFKARERELEL